MARAKKPQPLRFDRTLVLNQWMLSLFGLSGRDAFDQLADVVRTIPEGTDDDNVSHMFFALKAAYPDLEPLSVERLQEYDNNIVAHTQRINLKRSATGEPIRWKYFQYLALLFVEIYLDLYFTDPDQLRANLNAAIDRLNSERTDGRQMTPINVSGDARTQLNKIALWNATGSGKTLLMHVNQLQYDHYATRAEKRSAVNRVILLTPNEGLSAQHIAEYAASGIAAAFFDKNESSLFAGRRVDVVEITKLAEKSGDKTVDVDAFETNNLVFVDEGHRGASGETWMAMRNKLCSNGFSFEYSATFGQAVGAKPALADQYSRSILFDYSYRWFYKDGFGKDHQILNLDAGANDTHRFTYLVGGLISYYEQLRVFDVHRSTLAEFRIDKPLWVFVGSSVTASLGKDGPDIVQVLRFISDFVNNRAESEAAIARLLDGGLVGANGKNIFRGRFRHLAAMSAGEVFDDVLGRVFNTTSPGVLHVENLSGVDGEIALRVGTSDAPFGVINVGADAELVNLCEGEPGFDVGKRNFSESLFQTINDRDSTINLLIGSKKFTEGWNSWRVSTLGLLNVGRKEGSQIIQLFGRGVRLRGYEGGLKRSSALGQTIDVPDHLAVLETLGIFGVNADYMQTFRDFLDEEGIETDPEEVLIPVRVDLGDEPLQTLTLQDDVDGATTRGGYAFRTKAPVVTLRTPADVANSTMSAKLMRSVAVNWYPKLQARASAGNDHGAEPLNEARLSQGMRSFLDARTLHADLERFKAERGWHNVNISRTVVSDLLADDSWYVLHAPESVMSLSSFDNVRQWQQMAQALLRGYLSRFYALSKQAFELPLIAYRPLERSHKNLLGASTTVADGWHYRATTTDAVAAARLDELRSKAAGDEPVVAAWSFEGVQVLAVDAHVYVPVLAAAASSSVIAIEPVALEPTEADFARRLDEYTRKAGSLLEGWDVKFMRNHARGSGIGFYEGGGFYPDFVVWVTRPGRQHVVFVDPKGMRNLGGTHHLKVAFHREVKHIEERLRDTQPDIRLHSFLVSVTPPAELTTLWNVTVEELQDTGVVFRNDPDYLERIFEHVVTD